MFYTLLWDIILYLTIFWEIMMYEIMHLVRTPKPQLTKKLIYIS